MKSISPTLFTFLLLLLQSCFEKDETCNGICTEEYRTIVVHVETGDGAPVILDSFEVVDLRDGRDITPQLDDWTHEYQSERGIYPIFSDKYVGEYKQQQAQIKFSGFINGREAVNEIYKVAADCCHVYHVSGDLELVL